jgi:hypothetical protein
MTRGKHSERRSPCPWHLGHAIASPLQAFHACTGKAYLFHYAANVFAGERDKGRRGEILRPWGRCGCGRGTRYARRPQGRAHDDDWYARSLRWAEGLRGGFLALCACSCCTIQMPPCLPPAHADVFCISCSRCIGWRYIRAHDKSQKYTEGKVCLERNRIVLTYGSKDSLNSDSDDYC